MTPQEAATANRLFSQLATVKALPATPIAVAGLELRVALMLLQGKQVFPKADNEFWKRKCRSLFLRPAIEPIACSYWARFRPLDIDETTALKMASALAGRPLVYRKGPATGRSVAGDVNFGPLETPGGWLGKVASVAQTPGLLGALPAYCFAQTIMTHPFSDGNGRFARLMVQAALAQCADLDGPRIALAPAFYRRAEALGSAFTALSEHGDWSRFNRTFFAALDDALELTLALQSLVTASR